MSDLTYATEKQDLEKKQIAFNLSDDHFFRKRFEKLRNKRVKKKPKSLKKNIPKLKIIVSPKVEIKKVKIATEKETGFFRKKYSKIKKQRQITEIKIENKAFEKSKSLQVRVIKNNTFEKYYLNNVSDADTKTIVPISIYELVKDIVKYNANSIFQNIQSKISDEQIKYERGVLDPNFIFNIRRSDTENPNNAEEALSRSFQNQYLERKSDYELGLGGISVDGLQWNVKVSYNKRASSIIKQQRRYNREHENGLDLSLRQPLLKGKGKGVTLIKINMAKMNKKISIDQYKKKIMDLIGVAIQSYWRLYGAQKLYESWSESLKIANKQLSEIKIKVKSGMSPRTSILEINSAISLRKIELYSVKNQIVQYQNQVFSLLNLSASKNKNIILKAVGSPKISETRVPTLELSFKKAIENWPEFKIAKNKIEMEKMKIKFAKNQSKAQFDITANVNTNNLNDSSTFAYKAALSKENISWYLGLEYKMPMNNIMAKSNIKIEDLRLKQAELELESLYRSLNNGLYGKINKLISTREQLLELQNGMGIKRKLLSISKQKLHFGKTSIREIFDQQEKLINYQRKILSGVVELKLAKASLDKAVGTLLNRFDIKIDSAKDDLEVFEDKAYKGLR